MKRANIKKANKLLYSMIMMHFLKQINDDILFKNNKDYSSSLA